MNLHWEITDLDVKEVNKILDSYIDNPMVQDRIHRNLNGVGIDLSRKSIWYSLVSCLLTSQQRSGPESAVTRFQNTKPFPLDYDVCVFADNVRDFSKKIIENFGGLRFHNRLADHIEVDLNLLEKGLWEETIAVIEEIRKSDSVENEREAADYIEDNFKGFGPKQSRNLLQALGCTKYEIPIDSRITKWLNKFGFPVKLSAAALSDRNYYQFVSDGIQILCKESGVYPCVLDAAIFVSYDDDGWTNENIVR